MSMNLEMLDIYSDYLISQNNQASATGLSDLLENQISHDKITRFLHSGDFGSKELWKYVKPDLRKAEKCGQGVLILDDTIEEKPSTDENDIVCWHYSHAKGKHVKGMNIITCMARYGDISLPVGYEVVKKRIRFSDLETKKEKRKSDVTKNDMFRDMLNQAKKNHILFDYVLADNWFGSKENMLFIDAELKKKFIIGIKSNRSVALSRESGKKVEYHQVKSLNLKDGETCQVWLKELTMPLLLLKKVFINENGSAGSLYVVTNDISIDAERIYDIYQKRWKIEEFHKSIKQNASLAKSPTRRVKSQLNHIFSAMVSFCKLECLRIKTSMNHFAIKYKLIVKANQIAYAEIVRLRHAALNA